jgi:hypothetical protein
MKQLFTVLFMQIASMGILHAQTSPPVNQSALSQVVTTQANQMASLFKSGDYKGYVKYIHSFIVEGAGGEAKMIELLNKQNTQLKSRNVTVSNIACSLQVFPNVKHINKRTPMLVLSPT